MNGRLQLVDVVSVPNPSSTLSLRYLIKQHRSAILICDSRLIDILSGKTECAGRMVSPVQHKRSWLCQYVGEAAEDAETQPRVVQTAFTAQRDVIRSPAFGVKPRQTGSLIRLL